MPPQVLLLIFAVLGGALCVWSIERELRTGVATSRGWRFVAADNPFGYWLVVVSKGVILVFCAAIVLHALGIGPDPVALLRRYLPR